MNSNPYEPPSKPDSPAAKPGEYLTAPVPSEKMPGGIPYIIGNEAAERFSFYGMKAILVIFMTKFLVGSDGNLDVMTDAQAKVALHTFVFAVYFTPILGALISDAFWGKYKTILRLSVVYCGGHLALAMDESRWGLFIGLALIAIGSGGIKPCVSAHVGDQFGKTNQSLLARVFGWFYFAINVGAFLSTLATPWLLRSVWLNDWVPQEYRSRLAFGVPGVLMLLATIVFWLGRWKFVHIPPSGYEPVKRSFTGEGIRATLKLSILYFFVAIFWSLFDQGASSWVLQAEKMDRMIDLRWISWAGFGVIPDQWEILSDQVQSSNPLFILLLIPFFSYFVYPLVNRFFPLTPLRKMSIGFFFGALAFAIPTGIQMVIDAGYTPHVGWQVLAFFVITIAEIMISITGLEFSYSQAPKEMKSFIMSIWLLAVAVGNGITALVNLVLQDENHELVISETAYYSGFTLAMLIAACLFIPVAMRYRGKTYIQQEISAE